MEFKQDLIFFFLYLNSRDNSDFEDGLIEGSVKFTTLKNSQWAFIDDVSKRKSEYSILRFLYEDSDGNAIIKYKTSSGEDVNNKIINFQIKILIEVNLSIYI